MVYLYTAIGDSLTTGFGALPGHGFVPVYRRMAEMRLRSFVAYHNFGVNGQTAAELSRRLAAGPPYRQALRDADIITLSIGGNDLIRAARSAAGSDGLERSMDRALQECRRHFSDIMDQLYRIKGGTSRPCLIRIVGLYNPYPQMKTASDWVRRFNRYASQYASRSSGFADIYGAFQGRERELLSIDGLHPNGKGYRVIAEHLNHLGYGMIG